MRPLGHIRRGTLTFPVRRCTNFNQVSVVHCGVPKWMDILAFVLRMKFCLPGARALEDMVVLMVPWWTSAWMRRAGCALPVP